MSTTPATIHADDSGETVTGCFRLDVPHPPGYPLYSLLGRLFCLVPIGPLSWRVNILAVLLGAATIFLVVSLVRITARRVSGGLIANQLVALAAGVAALILAFSRNFWLQSTGAKGGVYTLNTLILAACFILLLKAADYAGSQAGKRSFLYPLFFLLGLGMTNHLPSVLILSLAFIIGVIYILKPEITWLRAGALVGALFAVAASCYLYLPGLVILVPPLLVIILSLLRPGICRPKWAVLLTICFLLGLSVYLYLPLRAALGPPINWYSPTKLERFLDVIMRRPYLEGEKLVDKDSGQLARQSFRYLITFKNEFNYLSSFLGLLGLGWLLRRGKRDYWAPLLAAYSMLVVAAVVYPSPQAKLVWLLDNYFLPANMIFSVFIGLGILWLAAKLRTSLPKMKWLAALLVLLALIPLFRNYQRNDNSYCYYSYDYGRNILATVEEGGVIFGEGDHNLMPLYYLVYSEGMRTDVSLVTTIFLHFDWGLNNLKRTHPHLVLNPSGGDINQRIVNIVNDNAARLPIYYSTSKGALEKFEVPIKDYLAPNGLLLRYVDQPAAGLPLARVFELADIWDRYCLRNLSQRLPCVDASTDLLFSYYASGRVNLGNSLQRAGRLNESLENYGHALEVLDGCLDCDEDLAPVYSNLAAIAGKREDLDQAKVLVEKALELDTEYAGAYANLGNIHRLGGDFISAEIAYRRALEIDPKSVTARSNLDNLTSGDRGKLAWQHVLRGDEHSRLGDREKAIEEYEVAVELGLKQHRLFSNLGVMYAQAGRNGQAEANFLKSLEVEPGFAEAHRNLAVLYYKAGEQMSRSGETGAAASEFRRARAAVNEGLKYTPDDPGLRQLLDIVEKALGNE